LPLVTQRLVWTGKTPFEISQIKAKPDGFQLVFTNPLDLATASDPASYSGKSHTFYLHRQVRQPVIDIGPSDDPIRDVAVDRLSVRLVVDGTDSSTSTSCTEGVRSEGEPAVCTPVGYYTLNQVPR